MVINRGTMKLLMFYIALAAPLAGLILFSENMPTAWFIAGLGVNLAYNLLLTTFYLQNVH
jgi:hypothetical protein